MVQSVAVHPPCAADNCADKHSDDDISATNGGNEHTHSDALTYGRRHQNTDIYTDDYSYKYTDFEDLGNYDDRSNGYANRNDSTRQTKDDSADAKERRGTR